VKTHLTVIAGRPVTVRESALDKARRKYGKPFVPKGFSGPSFLTRWLAKRTKGEAK